MKRLLSVLLFFLTTTAFPGVYLKILYIADHTVDCGASTCLLTRENPADPWKQFDLPITGFNYEKGYEYCILAEVTSYMNHPDVPFDSVHVKYALKEVRSKVKKDSIPAYSFIPDTVKWMLYKLKTKDGTRTFSVSKANIRFDSRQSTVTGETDCNTLNAGFSIDSSVVHFQNITTGKLTCKKQSIEPDFLYALKMATNYKLNKNLLYLYKGDYLLAMFTRFK